MQTRGGAPAGLKSPRSSTQLRGQLCPSPVPSLHAWGNLILRDCPASTPTRGPPPSHHLRASGRLQAGQELWTSDGRAVHTLSAWPHTWCDPGKSLCVLGSISACPTPRPGPQDGLPSRPALSYLPSQPPGSHLRPAPSLPRLTLSLPILRALPLLVNSPAPGSLLSDTLTASWAHLTSAPGSSLSLHRARLPQWAVSELKAWLVLLHLLVPRAKHRPGTQQLLTKHLFNGRMKEQACEGGRPRRAGRPCLSRPLT